MRKEEQAEGFKLTSQTELSPMDSSRQSLSEKPYEESRPTQSTSSAPQTTPVRHVYLEEQNTYGRFVPFLLLKDKLHADLDSSGHSALHHMCSHNSEYLPLYLSTLDKENPIINLKSKLGHSPLDVAGIYCRKQYVDMLIEKDAIDNGNADHWAIQGGNIYNWTGHVDTSKKYLIHWAAYNDMPDVLMEFYRQGANLSEKDANDFTPIDLAVINKSYGSFKVLIELGFRPKQQLAKQSQSKSIKRILDTATESQKSKKAKKTSKLLFIPLFCVLSWILLPGVGPQQSAFRVEYIPLLLTVLLWIVLAGLLKVQPQARYANTRYSSFHSDIIHSEVNIKSNHLLYIILNVMIFLTGLITLMECQTTNYFIAVLYFIELYITIVYLINMLSLIYGVAKNLTHEELFDSWKCKYLWKQIRYIQENKTLFRKFSNPLDRGVKENFKHYLTRNLN